MSSRKGISHTPKHAHVICGSFPVLLSSKCSRVINLGWSGWCSHWKGVVGLMQKQLPWGKRNLRLNRRVQHPFKDCFQLLLLCLSESCGEVLGLQRVSSGLTNPKSNQQQTVVWVVSNILQRTNQGSLFIALVHGERQKGNLGPLPFGKLQIHKKISLS